MNYNKDIFGNIYSFETFGTVDGPGIRFVVFMQGCMLKCKYCHNRDTWEFKEKNIISVKDLVSIILEYTNYIKPHGGVTISGGEPLLQIKFLINLFEELKKYNIHLALDTSGMVDLSSDVKHLLSLTDLILLDIKHINDEKCKKLVGFSNKKELEFARYLSDKNIPVWIRQVIIPGITDNEDDLYALKDFLSSLNNVQKIELLKYHDQGKFKWEKLNDCYLLEDVPPATDEDIKRAKEILQL